MRVTGLHRARLASKYTRVVRAVFGPTYREIGVKPTTRLSHYTAQPTLTAGFLAGYNVLIFTGLAKDSKNGPWWTFTTVELEAFQAWVNQGGGVIALDGTLGNRDEVNPDNMLLAFTGIQRPGHFPTRFRSH